MVKNRFILSVLFCVVTLAALIIYDVKESDQTHPQNFSAPPPSVHLTSPSEPFLAVLIAKEEGVAPTATEPPKDDSGSGGFQPYDDCAVALFVIPDNMSRRDPKLINAQARLVVYRNPDLTDPYGDAWHHSIELGEHRWLTRLDGETGVAETLVLSYLGGVDEDGNQLYEISNGYVPYSEFMPCDDPDCLVRSVG